MFQAKCVLLQAYKTSQLNVPSGSFDKNYTERSARQFAQLRMTCTKRVGVHIQYSNKIVTLRALCLHVQFTGSVERAAQVTSPQTSITCQPLILKN